MSSAASIAKKLATVMISTSRFAMCESSWASTPSISFGSSRRQRPGRHADRGVLRVAAGRERVRDGVSMTAIRGFGRSAIAQSRSTIACSSGASSRETIFAPEAASASLSEV